ncbi:phosphotransferase-like protein [Burkholderia cepacia]|uniref:phosphotransferase-like protein n=1 Tax=Burkholderia cepacia TaxID=292 RepID=UPI000B8237ED|nr:AAA family ATPase [Burkholderia cepacia]
MKPVAVVLHGPTSAGKSSLARALQQGSDVPTFHVSLDAFVEMSRRRDMRSDEELNQALRLHQLNLQSTLARIAASHFEIVLDLVLRDPAALDACIAALSPRRTFVIGVTCPLDILEQRERARPAPSSGIRLIRGLTRCASTRRHARRKRARAASVPTSTRCASDRRRA